MCAITIQLLFQVSVLKLFAKYKNMFDVDLGGEHGRTALHFAAIHDHDECASVLVSADGSCTCILFIYLH